MTSQLCDYEKQWENLDCCKTRQIICHSEGNDESFRKCNFLSKLRDSIKSYGQLSEILSYFSRFYHDLSLIILKSHDHGCQF